MALQVGTNLKLGNILLSASRLSKQVFSVFICDFRFSGRVKILIIKIVVLHGCLVDVDEEIRLLR